MLLQTIIFKNEQIKKWFDTLPRSCSKWSTTVCLHRWFSCLMLACRMRKDAHVIDRARRQCLWQHYATLYTRADIASRLMLCHTYWIHSYPSATYLQTLIPFLGQISDEVFSVLHTVIIVGSSIVLTKPSFDAFFFFGFIKTRPTVWLQQRSCGSINKPQYPLLIWNVWDIFTGGSNL